MVLLYAFLIILVGRGAQEDPGTPSSSEATSAWTLTNWTYQWEADAADLNHPPQWPADTAWTPMEIAFIQGPRENHVVWLRTRLPEPLPPQSVLVLPTVLLDFEAYIETTPIFSAREVSAYAGTKYASAHSYLVPFPPDAAGSWLYLRVHSTSTHFIGLGQPAFVGTTLAVLRRAWLDRADLFVIGAICTTLGLGAVFLLLTLRRKNELLLVGSFALLALTVGSNYLTDSIFVRIVLPFPVITYYASFSVIFFPVGLLGFFEQVVGAGPRQIVRWMAGLHLGFAVLIVLCDVAGILAIPDYFVPFFVLLALSLVVMTMVALVYIRGGQYEARIFGAVTLIAVVLGIHDTVFLGLGLKIDQPGVSQYGFVLLLFTSGYLVQYRFQNNTRQLEEKTAALADINATLEQRVAERTDALSTSLKHLKATQAQLIQQEKLASLGGLTAGIAHEIKNPLNFINNFAALSRELVDELAHETDPDEVRVILADLKTNAGKIETHGKRADNIVQSMMAHAQEGKGTRETVALNELIDEYVTLAYHGKRAHRPQLTVHIERDYGKNVGHVAVVPQDMGRVVLNLVGNAFDAVMERAASEKGAYEPIVRVVSCRKADAMEIRVEDNGPGMSPEVQAKVFEPFFTTKPTGSGTGLGLSLSYDIITQGHGGTLTVVSTPGAGATFLVRLPLPS